MWLMPFWPGEEGGVNRTLARPEGLWMCTSWVQGRPLIPPVSG